MPATAPRPEEPLSETELRALEGIGRGLADSSPRLEAELRRGPMWRLGDDLVAVLAVLVILGVLLPGAWFAVIVLLVAMAAPTLVALRLRNAGVGGPDTRRRPPPRRRPPA
jgi:hypothetical protein